MELVVVANAEAYAHSPWQGSLSPIIHIDTPTGVQVHLPDITAAMYDPSCNRDEAAGVVASMTEALVDVGGFNRSHSVLRLAPLSLGACITIHVPVSCTRPDLHRPHASSVDSDASRDRAASAASVSPMLVGASADGAGAGMGDVVLPPGGSGRTADGWPPSVDDELMLQDSATPGIAVRVEATAPFDGDLQALVPTLKPDLAPASRFLLGELCAMPSVVQLASSVRVRFIDSDCALVEVRTGGRLCAATLPY